MEGFVECGISFVIFFVKQDWRGSGGSHGGEYFNAVGRLES